MSLKKQKILKISLTTSAKKEILEYIQNGLKKAVKNGQKTFVLVTPNPEQVVLAQKNTHFAEVLNRADVAIPDGIGLVWAYRFLGLGGQLTRITGVTLMEDLVQMAAKERITVGLIGGREGVAVVALECLSKKYPGVQGWAMDGPEFKIQSTNQLINQLTNDEEHAEQEINQIANKIRKSGVQIVFVGLGAPKQEFFIEKLKTSLEKTRDKQISNVKSPILLMAVGGSFDEISGRLKVPLKFIDRYGLKWLWRLILEPWRWKRQLALVEFVGLVLRKRFL